MEAPQTTAETDARRRRPGLPHCVHTTIILKRKDHVKRETVYCVVARQTIHDLSGFRRSEASFTKCEAAAAAPPRLHDIVRDSPVLCSHAWVADAGFISNELFRSFSILLKLMWLSTYATTH